MSKYSTIVVGGGIIGAATAFHLAKAGAEEVLLLERAGIAEGTTPAGAGLISAWAAGNIAAWQNEELSFERYALEFYPALAERGYDINLHQNGHVWIGITQEGYDEHIVPMAKDESVSNKQVLDGNGVAEILPIVEADKIVGGVYHPDSIYLTTTMANQALIDEARDLGVEVRTYSPVDELIFEGGRVRGVRGPHGEARADDVVLALGAWTNSLLKHHDTWVA